MEEGKDSSRRMRAEKNELEEKEVDDDLNEQMSE